MPKIPAYTLAWSSATETYELYETRDRGVLKIAPESPAWFTWLDQVSSFAFSGKSGHFMARKEAKQRGDRYWYAYLATGKQLTKKYLGKTADITLRRLEDIARVLHADRAGGVQPMQAAVARPTQDETQVLPLLSPATGADGEGEAARMTTCAIPARASTWLWHGCALPRDVTIRWLLSSRRPYTSWIGCFVMPRSKHAL